MTVVETKGKESYGLPRLSRRCHCIVIVRSRFLGTATAHAVV